MSEPRMRIDDAAAVTPAMSADRWTTTLSVSWRPTSVGCWSPGPGEASTPQEREMWRRHADQRLQLRGVYPHDAAAIAALRKEFAGRLRALA